MKINLFSNCELRMVQFSIFYLNFALHFTDWKSMISDTIRELEQYDDTNPALYSFLVSTRGISIISFIGFMVFISATLIFNYYGEKATEIYAISFVSVLFLIRPFVGKNWIKMPSQNIKTSKKNH